MDGSHFPSNDTVPSSANALTSASSWVLMKSISSWCRIVRNTLRSPKPPRISLAKNRIFKARVGFSAHVRWKRMCISSTVASRNAPMVANKSKQSDPVVMCVTARFRLGFCWFALSVVATWPSSLRYNMYKALGIFRVPFLVLQNFPKRCLL